MANHEPIHQQRYNEEKTKQPVDWDLGITNQCTIHTQQKKRKKRKNMIFWWGFGQHETMHKIDTHRDKTGQKQETIGWGFRALGFTN